MMRRDIFTPEHEMFRAQVRRSVDAEIEPQVAEWNRAGMSDRASWRKMGEAGFLGATRPLSTAEAEWISSTTRS